MIDKISLYDLVKSFYDKDIVINDIIISDKNKEQMIEINYEDNRNE